MTKINTFLYCSKALSKKYTGKHVAVVDDAVVAVGKNRLDVYAKAIKHIPRNKKVGIYYLPTKKDLLKYMGTDVWRGDLDKMRS